MSVGPFWNYYGGKWRIAPRYQPPLHGRIIEPFAGAAGYACRYPHLDVTLIDSDEIIAGIWEYLSHATPEEILSIPIVDSTDDLAGWPQDARWLVGFLLNSGTSAPRKTRSKWARNKPGAPEFWSARRRARIARDVPKIKHWRIIHGTYTDAPDVPATWFIDPPYQRGGTHYRHGSRAVDFAALGRWCRSRQGQVIVCENDGADWLPFRRFADAKANSSRGVARVSKEVIWTSGDSPMFEWRRLAQGDER